LLPPTNERPVQSLRESPNSRRTVPAGLYGAPVLVETDQSEPILIAAEEYDAGVLPFTVKRDT